MTRARDIADLVDANGDIVAGALDNVPAADLVNDTTPQLGGALDAQSNNITSVGNLGIGTTAPAHEMHIQGSSTTASLSLKGSGTGTAASDGIELKLQGDNSAYLYNYENAMLRFGTNGLERMRIDASGRVTMPNQPSFEVRRGGGGISIGSTAQNYSAGNVIHNFGGHYNSSSHRFVAPVAGVYFFYFYSIQNNMATGAMQIRVNGNTIAYAHATTSSANWGTTTLPLTRSLSANDYVEAWWANSNGMFHGSPYSAFGGYLMG